MTELISCNALRTSAVEVGSVGDVFWRARYKLFRKAVTSFIVKLIASTKEYYRFSDKTIFLGRILMSSILSLYVWQWHVAVIFWRLLVVRRFSRLIACYYIQFFYVFYYLSLAYRYIKNWRNFSCHIRLRTECLDILLYSMYICTFRSQFVYLHT